MALNSREGEVKMPDNEQRASGASEHLTFEQRLDALATMLVADAQATARRIETDAQATARRIEAEAQATKERFEVEARQREISKAEFDRRMEAFDRRLESLAERHAAMAMNLELMSRDHEARHEAAMAEREKDAQHINALVRIAEIHERRLSDLEGPHPQ